MIKLRVPATSANMGAGFDTLGVAVGLYNRKYSKLYPTGYKQFDLPCNGGTFRLCRL